jgi:hypothetical protein
LTAEGIGPRQGHALRRDGRSADPGHPAAAGPARPGPRAARLLSFCPLADFRMHPMQHTKNDRPVGAPARPAATPRTAVVAALFAALFATAFAPPLAAQEKKPAPAKPAAKPAAKSKANVMSRDELRACMDEQDRLQALRTRIQQDNVALDRQKAAVLAMDEDLKKKAAGLDAVDEAGRKALEDEAVKRDQAADAYNAGVAALRQQGQTYDTGREAWARKCADRNYDEMDEAAIKKERSQAARAAKK